MCSSCLFCADMSTVTGWGYDAMRCGLALFVTFATNNALVTLRFATTYSKMYPIWSAPLLADLIAFAAQK